MVVTLLTPVPEDGVESEAAAAAAAAAVRGSRGDTDVVVK
jgi:hypothetical protein